MCEVAVTVAYMANTVVHAYVPNLELPDLANKKYRMLS